MFAREVVSACDDDEQLQQLREAEKTAPRPGVDFASRMSMATLFCCPSIAYHNVLVVVQGRATGQTASRPRSPSVCLPPNMDQPGHLLAGALYERALPIAVHPYHTSLTLLDRTTRSSSSSPLLARKPFPRLCARTCGARCSLPPSPRRHKV